MNFTEIVQKAKRHGLTFHRFNDQYAIRQNGVVIWQGTLHEAEVFLAEWKAMAI